MRDPQSITLEFVYPDSSTHPPAEAVNHFRISRIAGEIQLLTGFIDLGEMAERLDELRAKEDGTEDALRVPVSITRRFQLTPRGLRELKEKVDEIYKAMARSGHIEQEDEEPSDAVGDDDLAPSDE